MGHTWFLIVIIVLGFYKRDLWGGMWCTVFKDEYRGLNNYQYYFGEFLIISLVSFAPKPYSNY